MNRLLHILLLLALAISVSAGDNIVYQQFFNLGKSELKVDSVLPEFTHIIDLPGNFNDSVYTVQLVYPEFSEMSKREREECKRIMGSSDFSMAEQVEFIPKQSGYTLLSGLVHQVVVDRKKGKLEVMFAPVVTDGKTFKSLSDFMLRVKSEPRKSTLRKSASRSGAGEGVYADHSVLSSGKWAKISVKETGIHAITPEVIKKAGFSDISKVRLYGYGGNCQPEALSTDYLRKTDDLKEVATCLYNGKLYFHARGPVHYSDVSATRIRNPYSDYGYYFITDKSESGSESLCFNDTTEFLNHDKAIRSEAETYHVLHEKDEYAWFWGGRNLFENTPVETGKSQTYSFKLADYFKETVGKKYSARVVLTAGSKSSYEVLLNDSVVGKGIITLGTYDEGNSATVNFTFTTDNPRIAIKAVSGGPLRLDYIDIWTSSQRITPSIAGNKVPEAQYVYNITNQDLHADRDFDMVIIIPTSQKYRAQADRLKQFHEQHDGLKVRVVPADEIFNEFGSGTPDANAYRRYMKMLYDRAESADKMPKYLLLFGNGAFDNRMLSTEWRTANPDDYLLCFESENSFSEVRSYANDGFFCLLDEGEGARQTSADREDIGVGRLPVTSAAEAKIVVDKIISYAENRNAGSWQNNVVILGDDGDKNRHMADAESVAQALEDVTSDVYLKRVMWDTFKRESSSTGNTYPEIEKIVKEQQESGALIINYSGHGRDDMLSHESVILLKDFENYRNENLSFWITAACGVTPFDHRINHFGNVSLLNEHGGCIGFYGTKNSVYPTENRAINSAFMQALFTRVNGEYVTLGEAQRLAKNKLVSQNKDLTENKLQYVLLGDPALKLNIPEQKVVIDSINGKSLANTDALINMKAASIATVSGHVENNGAKDEAFSGIATIVVRDAVKKIVCRMNDEASADTAFVYYDRPSVIYKGNTSVKNGKFSFVFAVPKDIEYSGASGLINVVAVDNTTFKAAHGHSYQFEASETEDVYTDSIGPSLYCYLNSPSFQNGGTVNPTPFFYAEISDKDGINTSGGSYGHDMQLVIDDDVNKTFVLNDNFTFELGDYTKGTTYYSLPTLAPGKHTLRFRAWDILNNSSTTTLTFNVTNAIKPDLQDIYCTKNPARDNTSFIITHDRKGSDVNAEIEVMTMAGRPLWRKTVRGSSTSSGSFVIDWDLTTDGGGKLQTGVYLYRVRLSSDGSDSVSKAKKLIIIN
ncbi:MAG: type IX secretion system sortase PorU [Bacteroidaceae bacterium]|nr:type IX secretion system sortase PorU [Bacteroidaceae bacterium]